MATYTEIFNDVREYLLLDNISLPDSTLNLALRRLARNLTEEQIPIMKQQFVIPTDDFRNGYDLADWDYVLAVYSNVGFRLSLRNDVEAIRNDSADISDAFYSIIGNTITGYRLNDELTYTMTAYRTYNPANYNDGEGDPILHKHPNLIETGLIYQVMMIQKRPQQDLVLPLQDFQEAMKVARRQNYTYIDNHRNRRNY